MRINVKCRTNEDILVGVTWPNYVCCVPEIGQSIKSLDGCAVRKIVEITHCLETNSRVTTHNEPYLELQLA